MSEAIIVEETDDAYYDKIRYMELLNMLIDYVEPSYADRKEEQDVEK